MLHAFVLGITVAIALGFVALAAFLAYAAIRYAPIVGRIFEEKPFFLPLRLSAEPGGEDVRFKAQDGIDLAGTYYATPNSSRVGVLVFCHEYLSDRNSFQPYLAPLRSRGFDVFTFDFRSHGESAGEPNYSPLQWVSDHEVRDLNAALECVRSRADTDPAGVGLFGVSRGGGVALAVAGHDPTVWGVVTDGAFPTRGTMLSYIVRWAQIYVSNTYVRKSMPIWVYRFIASAARTRSEKRLNCRYPDLEKAVSRLSPRAWLMIHGENDSYIVPDIARGLFAHAKEPKELWIVPKAKHNRCRDVAPEQYLATVTAFLGKYAPRRPLAEAMPASSVSDPREAVVAGAPSRASAEAGLSESSVGGSLGAPVPG